MSNALTALYTGPLATAVADRDCATLLDAVNARNATQPRTIQVQEMFKALFDSGDYMQLKQAQMAGNQLAVMAFAVLEDANKFGAGVVDVHSPVTAELLGQLEAATLLSSAGHAALLALATKAVSPAESVLGRLATLNDIWESLE